MNDLLIHPAGSPVVAYLGHPIGRIKAATWREFFSKLQSGTDVGDNEPSVDRAVLDDLLSRICMMATQPPCSDVCSGRCFYNQQTGQFHVDQNDDGTLLKVLIRAESTLEDQIPMSWTISLEGLVS